MSKPSWPGFNKRTSHGIHSQLCPHRQETRTVLNHTLGEIVKGCFPVWFFGSWVSVTVCVGSGGRANGCQGSGHLLGGKLSTSLNIDLAGLYVLTSFHRHPTPTHTCNHTNIPSTSKLGGGAATRYQPRLSILNSVFGWAGR